MRLRKIILIVLSFVLCLTLTSCKFKRNNNNNNENNNNEEVETSKTSVNKPTANNLTFAYTGELITFLPDNFDSELMNITGNSETNVGTYTATVSLKDTDNYEWADSTTDSISYTWTIQEGVVSVTLPTINSEKYYYTGSELTYTPSGYNSSLMTISNNVQTNVGTYTVTVSLKDSTHYEWANSSSDPTFTFTINKGQLEKPTLSGISYYTGSSITFTPKGYDSNTMTISGNTQTEIGEYQVSVSIKDKDNYEWSDGTNSDLTITWTIEEKTLDYLVSEVSETEITVTHLVDSETQVLDCVYTSGMTYEVDQDTGVLTFTYTEVSSDNLTLTLSGDYTGSIYLNINEETNIDINLSAFNLTSRDNCPLNVLSANNADISASKGTTNTITDTRSAVSDDDISAAIYSLCDLKLKGKGTLTVTSENNNGIHTKDDLEVKNLTLNVTCVDNALKGNDSVTIESGTITLIATQGDGIKTSSTDLHSSDNSQKGNIEILDGTITVYAACDGIDASCNVSISGGTISIYTDKYSSYSEEVTYTSENIYYIRSSSTSYKYSIYYFNSTSDGVWVNSSSYKSVSNGRSYYYYYEMEKPSGYSYLKVYVYSSSQTQGQSTSYTQVSSTLTLNSSYDTIAYGSSSNRPGGSSSSTFSWTNYTTTSSSSYGPGGMGGGGTQDGNSDKSDYSTKGIKADNEISISGGTITIKAYDDAIHTNSDTTMESGLTVTGDIYITGGTITAYSNDDGIHADGDLNISDGSVSITNSYEGLEGNNINISGGTVEVISSDDGLNSYTLWNLTGGTIYVYAGGDGLDSNGKGIFAGANVIVVNTSGGNSCIDTESGFTYKSGTVLAVSPSGAMWSEVTRYASSGKYSTSLGSASSGQYVIAKTSSGTLIACVKIKSSMSLGAICLSSSGTSVTLSIGSYSSSNNYEFN